MNALSDADCLALWEALQARHPLDRALLLAAQAGAPADELADAPLGRSQAALLGLQRLWFGPHIEGLQACPGCAQLLSLPLDLERLPAAADPPAELTWRGRRFRLPSPRDLAAVADHRSADAAAQALLERLALDGLPEPWDAAACAEFEDRLDAADPLARLCSALQCAACGSEFEVELDPAVWLEQGLARRAQNLLDAVHRLASAYGWGEDQVLALSPARRQAYLCRLEANA